METHEIGLVAKKRNGVGYCEFGRELSCIDSLAVREGWSREQELQELYRTLCKMQGELLAEMALKGIRVKEEVF